MSTCDGSNFNLSSIPVVGRKTVSGKDQIKKKSCIPMRMCKKCVCLKKFQEHMLNYFHLFIESCFVVVTIISWTLLFLQDIVKTEEVAEKKHRQDHVCLIVIPYLVYKTCARSPIHFAVVLYTMTLIWLHFDYVSWSFVAVEQDINNFINIWKYVVSISTNWLYERPQVLNMNFVSSNTSNDSLF